MDASDDSPEKTFERKKLLNDKLFNIVLSNHCDVETVRDLENLFQEGAEIDFEDPDKNDLTPLAYAVSNRKFNLVPLLLKHGANVELSDNRLEENTKQVLSDFAWAQKEYNLVIQLLTNDAAFPKNFSKDFPKCTTGINPFSDEWWRLKVLEILTAERSKFHENIKTGKILSIKNFVQKFRNLKCAYNSNNYCALFSALDANRFEIFCYLRSEGFRFGVDTECKIRTQFLNKRDRSRLLHLMGKYFKSPGDQHIITLVSKSQISFDNDSVHFKKIVNFFESLNEIKEMKAVLRLVSDPVKSIAFDFNQESIINLHWTGCYIEDVNGRTYYDKGQILIGAKRENEDEVIGTLAHELTHMALQIVYGNRCLPFRKESSRKQEFERIVKTYDTKEKKTKHEIISKAFRSSDMHSKCVELIVAVPHAIALFRQDRKKLKEIRKEFKELFKFYSDFVLNDFDVGCRGIGAKEAVREINDSLGLISEIESFNLAIEDVKIDSSKMFFGENVLIKCNVPQLAFRDLMREQIGSNPKKWFIFVKQESLKDSNIKPRVLDFYDSRIKPRMIVLCTDASDLAAIIDPFLSRKRVVLISSIPEVCQTLHFRFEFRDFEYLWKDLTLQSKKKMLATKIQFQGHEISLNDIIGRDSNVLDEISLKEILELPNIAIEFIKSSSKIHIARKFQMSPKQVVLLENIVDFFETPNTLLLSDSAGSGKSMSAINLSRNFKQKYPCHWVVFLDLKIYTKFYCENVGKNQSITVDDLLQLLKLDKELKKKIFLHCYENQKVFFIFDGFDEICPAYKYFVLNLMLMVQRSSNSVLVTTRTFGAHELENELSTTAVKLMPFSERDQVDFLIQYWQILEETQQNEIILEEKAVRLLQQKLVTKDFFQNPLQLYMFAEVHEKIESSNNNQLENAKFNAYSLYYSFVEKKIEIWLSKGLEIMKEGTNLIMRSINPIHVHQKLALDELFFKEDDTKSFRLPQMRDASSIEVINRVGLIKLWDNNIEFMHQTLSEYFVAMFIVDNVTKESGIRSITALVMLFLKILRTVEYRKIRKFIDEGLGTMYDQEELETDYLSAKFEGIFKDKSNRDFLERIIIEEQTFLIRFFFQTLKLSKQTKLDLLRFKNKEGSEILHVAASYSKSFEVLWICIKSFTHSDEQKILLQANGAIGRNVVTSAVLNERVLTFVLKNVLSKMSPEEWLELLLNEDNESNSALHVITSNRHSSILDELWQKVKKKFTSEQQKTWFRKTGAYNETILQSLVRENNIKMLPCTLPIVSQIFDKREVRDFLLAEDFSGSTVVHNAARFSDVKVFKLIWDFYKQNLSDLDQQELLMKTMKHGHNIFHKASRSPDKNMISFVYDIAHNILEPENLWMLLKSKNYYGKSILTLTSEEATEIFSPELLPRIQNELSRDLLEENIICLSELASKIAGDIDASTVKAIMVDRMENITTLKCAVQFGSPKLVERLLTLFSDKLTKDEILHLILPDLLHFSLHNDQNEHAVSKSLFAFIVEKLSDLKVIEVLSGHDERNKTILILSIEVNCPTIFQFAEFYKNYDSEKFKDLFFRRDQSGEILVHHVARFCNAKMAQGFFDLILSPPFTESDRKNILLTKSAFKRNSLHRALKSQDELTFRIFYANYKNILGRDGLKKILFHDDLDYFNHGNHKTEKLVNLIKNLAIEDFGHETVNAVIHDDEVLTNLEWNEI